MKPENERNPEALISRIRYLLNKQIVTLLSDTGVEGIASSHAEILFLLHRNKELSLSQLSHRLGRDKSTLTVLVRELESLGYVHRVVSKTDRRVHLLTLTPKAADFNPVFEKIGRLLNRKTFQGFTPDETGMLLNLLTRILGNLSRE